MIALEQLSDRDRIQKCPKHLMQKTLAPCDDDVWERIKAHYRPYNVFVNIPYVTEYQPLQAVVIATLLKTRLSPRLAGLRSQGQPIRVCKICELMQYAKYCLTDLSKVPLHNMPFELGLSMGLGRQATSLLLIDQRYEIVDGKKVRKFDAQLSNLKGTEIIVHENKPELLVSNLLKRLRGDIAEASVPESVGRLIVSIDRLAKAIAEALENNTLDEVIVAFRRRLVEATRSRVQKNASATS